MRTRTWAEWDRARRDERNFAGFVELATKAREHLIAISAGTGHRDRRFEDVQHCTDGAGSFHIGFKTSVIADSQYNVQVAINNSGAANNIGCKYQATIQNIPLTIQ